MCFTMLHTHSSFVAIDCQQSPYFAAAMVKICGSSEASIPFAFGIKGDLELKIDSIQ